MSKIETTALSVLSADDHTIVRTGLQMLLHFKYGISKFYEAASCEELLAHVRKYTPTHLIVDMIFKDGNSLEVLPNVVSLFPDLKIMVYSMLPADVYAPVLQKIGINLYLHKGSPQALIEQTLKNFLFEKSPAANLQKEKEENPFRQLSPRELEVLHYLLRGEGIGAAATALNLHKSTVSTLRNRIYEKVGVSNVVELVEKAAINSIYP
ncbi:response regulator transcription factor [Flaviaesturariibacter amylovorans]|uniref:Response regulator n=1 Tax=Flaviaesturariibacter amylovorans TaxID=1084520 RepID=A0ABP8H5J0_9BACT